MSDAENFKGLQRFDVQFGGEDAWMGRQENGDYVLYDDAIARIAALEAQLAAADRLAELCEPLMDGTIEVDDAPLHVGEWYTDLAFTIAAYRAIRGGGNG